MTTWSVKVRPNRVRLTNPIEVKAGSAVVKIYQIINRGRILYTVTHYPTTGQRKRQNFADLKEAKAEAYRLAANLRKGDIEVLKLSNKDRSSYLHALAEIAPTGRNLELAATEFAGARRASRSKSSWPTGCSSSAAGRSILSAS